MIVIEARIRIEVISVPILSIRSIHIGGKVGMRRLQTVIHDADPHPATQHPAGQSEAPRILDIHVRSRDRSAARLEMPLLADQCIVRHRLLLTLNRQQDIRGFHRVFATEALDFRQRI